MDIKREIICAAGVPGLLLASVSLPVLPVIKYFVERMWTDIFSQE